MYFCFHDFMVSAVCIALVLFTSESIVVVFQIQKILRGRKETINHPD